MLRGSRPINNGRTAPARQARPTGTAKEPAGPGQAQVQPGHLEADHHALIETESIIWRQRRRRSPRKSCLRHTEHVWAPHQPSRACKALSPQLHPRTQQSTRPRRHSLHAGALSHTPLHHGSRFSSSSRPSCGHAQPGSPNTTLVRPPPSWERPSCMESPAQRRPARLSGGKTPGPLPGASRKQRSAALLFLTQRLAPVAPGNHHNAGVDVMRQDAGSCARRCVEENVVARRPLPTAFTSYPGNEPGWSRSG